ncbi:MAG: YdcF family protein [Deltaproteobacteria bacterium]|nr:YdcF family protein [Deltaproteobacteria bacterium]
MRKRAKPSLINPKVRRKQQSRRAKLIFLIILALAIIQLIASHQSILKALGEYLIFQQPAPQQADVIVILANWEDTIIRVRAGADLYKGELAKKIFVPRMQQMRGLEEIKKLGINIPENRDLVITILQGLGVPLDAIVTSAQEVTNTWDEAQEVRNLIEHKGYKSVVLVTSKYHSRRAYLIFKDALKGKATVISVPSSYDSSDPESWWKRDDDAKKVFMEYQKLLVYYWRKVF